MTGLDTDDNIEYFKYMYMYQLRLQANEMGKSEIRTYTIDRVNIDLHQSKFSGAGTPYPSEFIPDFSGVRVTRSLAF